MISLLYLAFYNLFYSPLKRQRGLFINLCIFICIYVHLKKRQKTVVVTNNDRQNAFYKGLD